eukprot:SAG31_NODE_37042_length_308_cov_0.559809_1_plen_99_part_01
MLPAAMILDAGLTLGAVVPAALILMVMYFVEGRADLLASAASIDFISPMWLCISVVLHLHSTLYCYIWTRPHKYMAACEQMPLKLFGSSPTHVYAHLAA